MMRLQLEALSDTNFVHVLETKRVHTKNILTVHNKVHTYTVQTVSLEMGRFIPAIGTLRPRQRELNAPFQLMKN